MKDRAVIGTAFNGAFRFYLLRASDTCNRALLNDTYEFLQADALSRSMLMTLTLSLMEKRDVSITSIIKSSGGIKSIVSSSLKKGTVRGYISPSRINGSFNDLPSAIGDGVLQIVRQYKDYKPYTSEIDLVNSTVTDDFMHLFSQSDQVNTAILFGSLYDKSSFTNCTSILIQVMPNAKDDDIFILEERLKELPKFSKMIEEDDLYILNEIFIPKNYKVLETSDISFYCNCSKEKFFNNLKLLKKEEVEGISEDTIECVCNFCNKKYKFKKSDVLKEFKS